MQSTSMRRIARTVHTARTAPITAARVATARRVTTARQPPLPGATQRRVVLIITAEVLSAHQVATLSISHRVQLPEPAVPGRARPTSRK